MLRPIIGYHQDEESHWVAQLACGHNQHVRHTPPWVVRDWVTHLESRMAHLGQQLNCVKCEQHAPVDDRPLMGELGQPNSYSLAQALGNILNAHGWTTSSAESCTGGLIAAAITDIAGSSAWFEQGWVTYCNEAKQQQLGVSSEALQNGAVSRAVVEAMAEGARVQSRAHCAVATSGIAGPSGGTADKPVGTVWIGWSGPWGVCSERFIFQGDRQQVRHLSVLSALTRLIMLLSEAKK